MVWVGTFKGLLVELWESLGMFLGFFSPSKVRCFWEDRWEREFSSLHCGIVAPVTLVMVQGTNGDRRSWAAQGLLGQKQSTVWKLLLLFPRA